jgi:hypothetical protein
MRHAITFQCLGGEMGLGSCDRERLFLAVATVRIRAALFKHVLRAVRAAFAASGLIQSALTQFKRRLPAAKWTIDFQRTSLKK